MIAALQEQWPYDYGAEYQRRLFMLQAAENDLMLRGQLMLYYRYNFRAWVNDICVTFDPRKRHPEPKIMPFLTFKRQDEFSDFLMGCYNDRENGLVEKARDIGASWLCCAFSVWLWLFWPGSAIGWGSRKEEYVDKRGDPKAIFTKLRQLISNLPYWMKPTGYTPRLHDSHMKLLNPENESTITGEAGDNIGRGGRTTIYFKDESAHYERPEVVEAAIGENTDVQIDISSVNGSGNVFYRRRKAGQLWTTGAEMEKGRVRVFVFDWSEHPGKNQEWYDMKRARAEAEGLLHVFKQEIERDYSGSQVGVIIPAEWARAAVDAHIKLGIQPSGEKVAGQDLADGGRDKNALVARHGIVCNHASMWGGESGDAALHAIPICIELGVQEIYYDAGGGYGSGFKTQVNNMKDNKTCPDNIRLQAWMPGGKVLDPEMNIIPGDSETPTNEDQYANLKAQSWFRTRTRFYKTWRAVTCGDKYPPDELISIDSTIPLREQLIIELSQPVKKQSETGKTMVDKKPNDTDSPNLADGLIQCYNPTRELSILDVL